MFPITGMEFAIGRDRSNLLVLDDPSVSACQCVLRRDGGRLVVTEVDNRGVTFVNGLPIRQQQLQHGDQLEIGRFVFQVNCAEALPVDTSEVRLVKDSAGLRVLANLSPAEGLYEARKEERGTDIDALIRISNVISSIRGFVALERPLLELLFDAIPAERGAILISGKESGDFSSIVGVERGGRAKSIEVDLSAIDRAVREGVASLLEGQPGHRVLAVPLTTFDRVLGAIYLESFESGPRLEERHLKFVAAIGGVAGMALDYSRRAEQLEEENRRLRAEITIEHNMVGESPAMRELFHQIARLAPSDATVLVCGESGTGKELAVRALHRNSPRAARPFMAINCAAITESLLEAELFGYEKGAFTGAIALKRGKLEMADGGTVFLDEIGELALPLQAKLLRVLQEREFERVGGTRTVRVDFRLVAATNRDLEQAVKSGAFRQDLFYRINVVSLTMPPLRHRREDIPMLARHFIRKHAAKTNVRVEVLSTDALAALERYEWPGNVRELENAVERAIVLGTSTVISPEDLPESVLKTPSATASRPTTYHEAIRQAKTKAIQKAMAQTHGRHSDAARLLAVHPNYLHRLIRNLRLKAILPGR